MVTTAANVNDATQAGTLLHGQKTVAFGDAGYRDVEKREEKARSCASQPQVRLEHPK